MYVSILKVSEQITASQHCLKAVLPQTAKTGRHWEEADPSHLLGLLGMMNQCEAYKQTMLCGLISA